MTTRLLCCQARRDVWPSREAAREHLASRTGVRWVTSAIEAFEAHSLREAADGTVHLVCSPQIEGGNLRWPGEPLPALASAYTGTASFSVFVCDASRFSPVGLPGSGGVYYTHALARAFPGPRGASVRRLGGSATHYVAQEQPEVLARGIVDDLRAHGLLNGRGVS